MRACYQSIAKQLGTSGTRKGGHWQSILVNTVNTTGTLLVVAMNETNRVILPNDVGLRVVLAPVAAAGGFDALSDCYVAQTDEETLCDSNQFIPRRN